MRLLRICDGRSLTLTKDIIHDDDILAYAILSHTWGSDDQEVSFADMVAGKGEYKEGYRKIEFCSNQARLDGFRYFWVDTCCIDKSNNNELSEAINSMFRWYQRAAKCYVYLADVGETTTRRTIGSDVEKELRASRWFTRGWTLQELLAPLSVEFFGSDGQQLGSKQSLKGLINEIIGIAIKSLQGEPLSNFTTEERKSTIARTVACHAAESGCLGASFFFKRGENDRFGTSTFFSTIAAQFARKERSFALHLSSTLEDDFSICEADLERQFEKMIIGPFRKTFKHYGNDKTIVIVVDALDECEEETNVKQIIDLFSRANHTMALYPRLRIFVTSRPDIPIRLGFKAVRGTYEDFILHEVPEPVIRQDLSVYFQSELATIRNEYNRFVSRTHRQLPAQWPTSSHLESLINMATPLFIFAATICRFIADRRYGNPRKNLQTVLRYRTKSQESKLDNTYRPVLDMILMGQSRRERIEAIREFRVIVGSIVILAEPLSACTLATLVDVPQSTVDDRLDMFHSVLDVPSTSTSPVRLLHLSFRDFLTDPDKREQYEF
ncbi:hypothetical protein E0Z10_g10194 [Xylaria hypoxylon]|uniref:Uncharacterized protein n=1 Tax=Xylaria hypoxylon TaxID=37992 RepID=A0A4Z0YLN5_9PEZI|nr:hypothetical protein E0Z10_g10194 [Xylaria hypoxylon]